MRMARTERSDGVLVIDKPTGMTSHDVVDVIRKRFGNLFPSPHPMTEIASFHNEDQIFILEGQDK